MVWSSFWNPWVSLFYDFSEKLNRAKRVPYIFRTLTTKVYPSTSGPIWSKKPGKDENSTDSNIPYTKSSSLTTGRTKSLTTGSPTTQNVATETTILITIPSTTKSTSEATMIKSQSPKVKPVTSVPKSTTARRSITTSDLFSNEKSTAELFLTTPISYDSEPMSSTSLDIQSTQNYLLSTTRVKNRWAISLSEGISQNFWRKNFNIDFLIQWEKINGFVTYGIFNFCLEILNAQYLIFI